MSLQEFFQSKYHDLVLHKSLDIRLGHSDCYLELSDQGDSVCILTTLLSDKKKLTEDFLEEIESLQTKGLGVDRQSGKIYLARKHDFRSMNDKTFGLRMAQFYSEAIIYRRDIDGLAGKEYAPVKRT